MEQTPTRGIIYIATGEKFIKEAMLSAKSVRQHCGDLSMTLFTDQPEKAEESGYFESVIKIEKRGTEKLKTYDKVLHLKDTPYDQTIFMDTDTYVMSDFREVFRLFPKFDLAIAHSPNRNRNQVHYEQNGGVGENPIPPSFPTLQSGVIVYQKNEKVLKTLEEFIRTYEEKQFFFDQFSLKEVLWLNKQNLNIWILPPEYNLTKVDFIKIWKDNEYIQAYPKIFHYCGHKGKDIEAFAKQLVKVEEPIVLTRKQKAFASLKGKAKKAFKMMGLMP